MTVINWAFSSLLSLSPSLPLISTPSLSYSSEIPILEKSIHCDPSHSQKFPYSTREGRAHRFCCFAFFTMPFCCTLTGSHHSCLLPHTWPTPLPPPPHTYPCLCSPAHLYTHHTAPSLCSGIELDSIPASCWTGVAYTLCICAFILLPQPCALPFVAAWPCGVASVA